MLRKKKVVDPRIDPKQHNTQDTRVTSNGLPQGHETKKGKYTWIPTWVKMCFFRQLVDYLWENKLEIWSQICAFGTMVLEALAS